MRKFFRALAPAAALVGVLAFAGTASASVTHDPQGGSQGGSYQQGPCPQGNQWQGDNGGNKNGKDGCQCQGQYSWGQQQSWNQGCEQCKTVTEYVKETVWVRTWKGWAKETRWVRKDVQVCQPGNQGGWGNQNGGGNNGGGCGCQGGNNGGGGQGGSSCTPVTVKVTSEGGATITEVSDTPLTQGEEVAYGSTDYWVIDVSHGSPVTFELSTTNPQDSTTLWTTNGGSEGDPLSWSLDTVCATR